MKRKGMRIETVNKYLLACYDLKNKCDNKIKFNLSHETNKYNITNSLGTFLKSKNIIYSDFNGFYEWNKNIPVTHKLISSFSDYIYQTNLKNHISRKNKQTPTLFNESRYIKDANKMNVAIADEVKEKEYIEKYTTKKVAKQKVENEKLGLIRRFIKWIY